ncbi:hypothetical protein GCM10007416_21470 [Kroppenstedtia guangzhouensis]|uniref:Phr family secreted Rap phosphatase inhibitor n=1 Tax=Kroppenstedtia guangzhouensis TaxID=1274356 RepID=A0ABQ1GQ84_9BACL|nr:hypothetical protein GCM10007416_21470 [Kroppenstedtia guangzhouensis]
MKWIKKGVMVFICGLILAVSTYYGVVEEDPASDSIADNRPNTDDPAGA